MRPARNLNFLIDTHRNILKTFVKLFFLYLQYFLKYDAFKFSPDEDYCHARWSLLNLQQITQWRPLAFAWRLLLYDEVYLPYKHASITMTATAINLCEISLRLSLRYRFAFHIALLRKNKSKWNLYNLKILYTIEYICQYIWNNSHSGKIKRSAIF